MGQGKADHLHRVERPHADAAFGQRHARIFAQRHAVVDVVVLAVFIARARHQRLTDAVAGKVTVPCVDVRIAAVFIRRTGVFAQHDQQLVLGLLDRAVDVFNARRLQFLMAAAEHREQVFDPRDALFLRRNHLIADGIFIQRGGGRNNRCSGRTLRRRRVLGSRFRLSDHVFQCVWHSVEFLDTF